MLASAIPDVNWNAPFIFVMSTPKFFDTDPTALMAISGTMPSISGYSNSDESTEAAFTTSMMTSMTTSINVTTTTNTV